MYKTLSRAAAGLMYAYFILGAVMRSNDDMRELYTVQLFAEIEVMIWIL